MKAPLDIREKKRGTKETEEQDEKNITYRKTF
jgi:hypothetical protein